MLKYRGKDGNMSFLIPLNASARKTILVEEALTAAHIGSGSILVLATPMMIALMEAAALEAVQPYLSKGLTTVGTKVDVEHVRPTPVGEEVTAEALLTKTEDRLLEFTVKAMDRKGLIGQGTHQRFIIDEEKFLVKIRDRD
jgi:fluoroacetyl-CoA thioesterase